MSNIAEALEVFRHGPFAIEDALRGVSEEELAFVPGPGKWTIRQIVRHVADTEIVVGMRLRQIIAEDRPTLIPFDQDAWAANLGYGNGYEKADAFDSADLFRTIRNSTSALLYALPPGAFDRVGVHPERGAKTLLEWVSLFGNHAETHAAQVRAIREAWSSR